LGSKALILGNNALAKDGVINFEKISFRIVPASQATIKVTLEDLDSFKNAIDFIDAPTEFTVDARACVEGEQYTSELACAPCPTRFFSYLVQTSPGGCQNCDVNAKCYGMNHTAPKPGYWRQNATDETYWECPRPESCLGGNSTNPYGECDVGY
jgi:hypothetical protein